MIRVIYFVKYLSNSTVITLYDTIEEALPDINKRLGNYIQGVGTCHRIEIEICEPAIKPISNIIK